MATEREEESVPYLENADRIIAVKGGGYWPTLFKLKDGSLGAVVRGGASHVGLKGRLDWIHSEDGGKTWSKPSVIVNSEWDDRGTASGQMKDGTIVVAYWEASTYKNNKYDPSVGGTTPYYVYSADNGRTWSKKQKLEVKADDYPLCCPYGRIEVLSDGTALMAAYGSKYDNGKLNFVSGLIRSKNNGRTWGDGSIIAKEFNETAVISAGGGKLLAFLREKGVYQSESTDGGIIWSEPKQLTEKGQHPADACLLQSGNILLTYGNRIGELAVGAMLSYDKGKTWDHDHRVILAKDTLILKGSDLERDCGYPSTVQLDNGTIVTMYYRVGSKLLSKNDQRLCIQYVNDGWYNPPASEDLRRFEEGICIIYTEKQLKSIL